MTTTATTTTTDRVEQLCRDAQLQLQPWQRQLVQRMFDGETTEPPTWAEFTRPAPTPVDVVDVFAKLVREVDAGRALVAMTPLGERHRAAADALALARDVLVDARELMGSCACTAVDLVVDELGGSHVVDGIAHAPTACVRVDETTGEQL